MSCALRCASTGVAALLALASCVDALQDADPDSSLEGLSLSSIGPEVVVPGTRLRIRGTSFVAAPWGRSRVRLKGRIAGAAVDFTLDAEFSSYQGLEADSAPLLQRSNGGDADFVGEFWVEVDSAADGRIYATEPKPVKLFIRSELAPELAAFPQGAVGFANDRVAVRGHGILLGGDEGRTYARLSGCFRDTGSDTCQPIGIVDVPVDPASPTDRSLGSFVLAPEIVGIGGGILEATVTLRNVPARGAVRKSVETELRYGVSRPALHSISPDSASLGQYVVIAGGGFVATDDVGSTLIELRGVIERDNAPSINVDVQLVPQFFSGRDVRYVVDGSDALGRLIDLRKWGGRFRGVAIPMVRFRGREVRGQATEVTFDLAPPRQVVWLCFRPAYVESLRRFGLRAVDHAIRSRVTEVVERDFAGVNLEVRLEEPRDFALYSRVDVLGPDPNGIGLLGYDNTPGKDVGNLRLHDRIGGVNALTQEDGSPGYGGIFVESVLTFSEHPPEGIARTARTDAAFDEIFDPFRPDRGRPVVAADLDSALPRIDGSRCPATSGDRRERIACAIWVLGSVIGTTLSHEIGHSLGLANPYGEGFHNHGDEPGRLMDQGGAREFVERAELFGAGPGRFCRDEYEYLREILPGQTDAQVERPTCF